MRSGACAVVHVWRSDDSLQWCGLLSTMWAWELNSQVTRFDKRRSLLTEPSHWPLVSFFWDKVSLPSLDWPQIYYIAQTSVKLFKFLKFYLVYIYLCACLHTCLSVYAHWCTLVHACIYTTVCVEVRGGSFLLPSRWSWRSTKLVSKCLYLRASWLWI